MSFTEYCRTLGSIYKSGQDTEHSYRPALQDLLEALGSDIGAMNEPTQAGYGAPDFIGSSRMRVE